MERTRIVWSIIGDPHPGTRRGHPNLGSILLMKTQDWRAVLNHIKCQPDPNDFHTLQSTFPCLHVKASRANSGGRWRSPERNGRQFLITDEFQQIIVAHCSWSNLWEMAKNCHKEYDYFDEPAELPSRGTLVRKKSSHVGKTGTASGPRSKENACPISKILRN